jgi:hypothetical protein
VRWWTCGEISLQRRGKATKKAVAAYERQEEKGRGGRGEGWRRERYPSSAQNIGSVSYSSKQLIQMNGEEKIMYVEFS